MLLPGNFIIALPLSENVIVPDDCSKGTNVYLITPSVLPEYQGYVATT
nr:MAG TPA: hypothetical protein [Bacteriophage sp.]